MAAGEIGVAGEAVRPVEARMRCQVEGAAQVALQPVGEGIGVLLRWDRIRQQGEHQPLRVFEHVIDAEPAGAFRCALASAADQAGEAGIGGAVARISQQAEPVRRSGPLVGAKGLCLVGRHILHQIEARADHVTDARLLRRQMAPYHAGQAVAVGERDGLQAQCRRRDRQFVGMRSALQKAEIAGDVQFGIGRHVMR